MERWVVGLLVLTLLGGCTVYEPGSIVYGQPAIASASTGQTCREFQATAMIDGRSQLVRGTACQQPDGSWRSAPGTQ
jgi:surface antigen